MIRVHGASVGDEADAARELADMAGRAWPWAKTDPRANIDILAGVQCYGQPRQDLDVVVLVDVPAQLAAFNPHLSCQPQGDATPTTLPEVRVAGLCLVVEVKSSDPSSVRFEGNRTEVRYTGPTGRRWHDVTSQSEGQKYALINYLKSRDTHPPHVVNLIWLRALSAGQLPPRPHNVLPSNLTWTLLLNVVAQLKPPQWQNGGWLMTAWWGGEARSMPAVAQVLARPLVPTRLDSLRMALLTEAAVDPEWADVLGQRQLVLRGRGGTGKTMLLLQLAKRAYEREGARVLLLTYNKALLADIRRLLTLVGVGADVAGRAVEGQTVHAFLRAVLLGLGILGDGDDFIGRYRELVGEALALCRARAITPGDIEQLVRRNTGAFGWDYILIDEAQDWPDDERDLLRAIYAPARFAVADGVDQMVWTQEPCNWRVGLLPEQTHTVPLSASLRLKTNLTQFANALAAELKLPGWTLEASEGAHGGRVVIVLGDFFADPTLLDGLIEANAADGNQPVDMLCCVPPADVERTEGSASSGVGRKLREAGHEVWDGVDAEVRAGFPVSPRQFRVVQYDSCRGLEGWTVIAFGLDSFYEYKRVTLATAGGPVQADDPAGAARWATRWLMIPLTRAVDTLVLHVNEVDSPLGQTLVRVGRRYADFVEFRS